MCYPIQCSICFFKQCIIFFTEQMIPWFDWSLFRPSQKTVCKLNAKCNVLILKTWIYLLFLMFSRTAQFSFRWLHLSHASVHGADPISFYLLDPKKVKKQMFYKHGLILIWSILRKRSDTTGDSTNIFLWQIDELAPQIEMESKNKVLILHINVSF